MRVNAIQLDFWRNYLHLEAKFSPNVNVIYGENAQGKTNLLEAVAYLSTGTSHRARFNRELLQFGINHGFVQGEVWAQGRDFTLEARLSRAGPRHIYANGVKLKTAGELTGILRTALFCPEDLSLIRDGAAARRRFLDDCICQLRPKYADALAEYRRLHEHKIRILRDSDQKPSLLDTLDDFSHQMARVGAIVVHYRAHFVKKLSQFTPEIHRDFSGGREDLVLGYETVSTIDDPLRPAKELLNQILEHQESHRTAEIEAKTCLSGPHKDDLTVEIGGNNARTFASQGQTRTAALSLKLGARELFYEDTGEWPVLLLDDVLSELDARRQSFVLNRIQGGQVFLTCCEETPLAGLERGATFHIKNGALV